MEEILVTMKVYEELLAKNETEKKDNTQKGRNIAEDIRNRCMETFGETSKRKSSEEDETPKKKRRTGSETVTYLREKAERDYKLKEQEMPIKQTEQS